MLDTEEVGNSLRELIQRRSWDELRGRIRDMNPSDVADLIIALPPEEEKDARRGEDQDQNEQKVWVQDGHDAQDRESYEPKPG